METIFCEFNHFLQGKYNENMELKENRNLVTQSRGYPTAPGMISL